MKKSYSNYFSEELKTKIFILNICQSQKNYGFQQNGIYSIDANQVTRTVSLTQFINKRMHVGFCGVSPRPQPRKGSNSNNQPTKGCNCDNEMLYTNVQPSSTYKTFISCGS